MGQTAERRHPLSRIVLVQAMVLGVAFWAGSELHGLKVSAQTEATGTSASSSGTQAKSPGKQTPPGIHKDEFPDGPGKSDLMQVCTQCHSATLVLANRQNRQGWEDTITKMAGMGANGTDQQYTAILDYLTKNFSPLPSDTKVDVNTATPADIASGLNISSADAQAIVAYRAQNGPFKSLDDLRRVPGINLEKLNASANLVTF